VRVDLLPATEHALVHARAAPHLFVLPLNGCSRSKANVHIHKRRFMYL